MLPGDNYNLDRKTGTLLVIMVVALIAFTVHIGVQNRSKRTVAEPAVTPLLELSCISPNRCYEKKVIFGRECIVANGGSGVSCNWSAPPSSPTK